MTAPDPSGHDARAHAAQLRGDLVRGSLWTFVATLLGLPVSFVVNLLVVRSLGAEEFARYAVLTAAYLVAVTVATAGFTVAAGQELAVARAAGDLRRADEVVRRCSGFACLVQAPVLAGTSVVLLRDAGVWVWAGAASLSVLAVLPSTALVVLTGSARNTVAAQANLAMTVLGQAAVAVVAVTTKDAADTLVARLAAFVVAPAVALASITPRERAAVLRPLAPWRLDRAFRATALAFWGLSIAGFLLVERTEIFVLRADGDLVAVAAFALATTLAGQLTAPMDSLIAPLAPTSAGLIAVDATYGPRLLRTSLRVSALAGALTCGTLVPPLVVLAPSIYGSAYAGETAAFLTLAVVSCLDSVFTPVRALAFGLRAPAAILRLTLLSLLLDIALAVALIPPLGLGGAVVALGAGQAVFVALLLRLVGARTSVRPLRALGWARAAAISPVAAVLAVMVTAPIGEPVPRALAAAAGGLVVTLVVLATVPTLRLGALDLDQVVRALPGRSAGPVMAALTRLRLVDGAARARP